MGVQIKWDNDEHTILLYQFTGRWTWEEFYAAYDEARELLSQITHHVDFICVGSPVGTAIHVPSDVLIHVRNVQSQRLPNAGITVVVDASVLVNVLYQMFWRVYPLIAERYLIAATLEEARELLRSKHT